MRSLCVLALLMIPGCFVSVVDDTGVVACGADGASCPAGTTCAVVLDRCLDATREQEAPRATLTPPPALVRAGDTLLLRLEASEPLVRPPQVTAGLAFSVEADGEDEDGRAFVLRYQVGGQEPERVPLAATLQVVDHAGNVGAVDVPAIVCDFTAPTLALTVVDAGSAERVTDLPSRSERRVRIVIDADEPVAPLGVVTADLRVVPPDVEGDVGVHWSFTLSAGEATRALLPAFRDAVGNATAAPSLPTLSLDDDPPPARALRVTPPVVSAATTSLVLDAAASADEQASLAIVNAAGAPLACEPTGRGSCVISFNELGEDGLPDLPLTALATVSDLAGNATPLAPVIVLVDRTSPVATLSAPVRAKGSAAAAAVFVSNEPVNVTLACLNDAGEVIDSRAFTAITRAQLDCLVPASAHASWRAQGIVDVVGNPAADLTATTIIDREPPALVAVEVTPQPAGPNDALTVLAAWRGGSAFEVFVDGADVGCAEDDGALRCEIPAEALAGDAAVITLVAEDDVGNRAQRTLIAARDLVAPAFTGAPVLESDPVHPAITRLGPRRTVIVDVTASEPLRDPPTLALGGGPPTPCTSLTGSFFRCAITAATDLPELADVDLLVHGVDLVGNVGDVVVGTVTLDGVASPPPVESDAIVVDHIDVDDAVLAATPPQTFEPGSFVEIFDSANRRVGVVVAGADGATVEVRLGAADRFRMRVVDGAGNQAALLRVLHHRTQVAFGTSFGQRPVPLGERSLGVGSVQGLLSPVARDPDSGDIVGVFQDFNLCSPPLFLNRLHAGALRQRQLPAGQRVTILAAVAGEGVLAQTDNALVFTLGGSDGVDLLPVALPCAPPESATLVPSADGAVAGLVCRASANAVALYLRRQTAWELAFAGDDSDAIWTIDSDGSLYGQTRVRVSAFFSRLSGETVRVVDGALVTAGPAPQQWAGRHAVLGDGSRVQLETGGPLQAVDVQGVARVLHSGVTVDGVSIGEASRFTSWVPADVEGCVWRVGMQIDFEGGDCGICSCGVAYAGDVVEGCPADVENTFAGAVSLPPPVPGPHALRLVAAGAASVVDDDGAPRAARVDLRCGAAVSTVDLDAAGTFALTSAPGSAVSACGVNVVAVARSGRALQATLSGSGTVTFDYAP